MVGTRRSAHSVAMDTSSIGVLAPIDPLDRLRALLFEIERIGRRLQSLPADASAERVTLRRRRRQLRHEVRSVRPLGR